MMARKGLEIPDGVVMMDNGKIVIPDESDNRLVVF